MSGNYAKSLKKLRDKRPSITQADYDSRLRQIQTQFGITGNPSVAGKKKKSKASTSGRKMTETTDWVTVNLNGDLGTASNSTADLLDPAHWGPLSGWEYELLSTRYEVKAVATTVPFRANIYGVYSEGVPSAPTKIKVPTIEKMKGVNMKTVTHLTSGVQKIPLSFRAGDARLYKPGSTARLAGVWVMEGSRQNSELMGCMKLRRVSEFMIKERSQSGSDLVIV